MKKIPEYIDREAVIELAKRNKAACSCIADIVDVKEIVNDVPAADVVPVVRAEWEEVVTHNGCTPDYDCVCSNCKESGLPTYKYCPSLGA
ncbi:MAG: hypothetical protein ACI4JN_06475 [Ruminococcus sp.]